MQVCNAARPTLMLKSSVNTSLIKMKSSNEYNINTAEFENLKINVNSNYKFRSDPCKSISGYSALVMSASISSVGQ